MYPLKVFAHFRMMIPVNIKPDSHMQRRVKIGGMLTQTCAVNYMAIGEFEIFKIEKGAKRICSDRNKHYPPAHLFIDYKIEDLPRIFAGFPRLLIAT